MLATPVLVFAVKPDALRVYKTARLLLALLIIFAGAAYSVSFHECQTYTPFYECVKYKSLMMALAAFPFVMGLGGCELLWRKHYNQLAWPLQENFKYGLVSNLLILTAFLQTGLMVSVLF